MNKTLALQQTDQVQAYMRDWFARCPGCATACAEWIDERLERGSSGHDDVEYMIAVLAYIGHAMAIAGTSDE